jgi:hypothetical protein
MGDEYAVTSIFKPNADLSNVTGELKTCVRVLIKKTR